MRWDLLAVDRDPGLALVVELRRARCRDAERADHEDDSSDAGEQARAAVHDFGPKNVVVMRGAPMC